MIELANVKKEYHSSSNHVEALKGVSIKVERSDIFGVIGYSGAGKSTLIRCINLLEHPDSGNVIVDDKDITNQSEKELMATRQKIGMIFQHFNLLKSKTVYDNIAFPLKYMKKSKGEIKQKVDELLSLVGLTDKIYSYPSQLSGGQKQRVAIARALANAPQILLCDEATSSLDPQTTDSILELLMELNKKLGLTILIITHEMNVVKEICNKIAVMENGYIVEQGSSYEIFSNPKTEITKKFVSGLFKMDGINKLLTQIDSRQLIGETGKLLHLIFLGEKANDAYISKIIKMYDVDVSIIYGCIEVIQAQPIGSIFVTIKGTPLHIQQSINYLKSNDVSVSVLIDGEKEYKGDNFNERNIFETIS